MRQGRTRELDQRSATQVLHHRETALASDRRELGQVHLGHEPALLEIAPMHLEQQRGLGTDRAAVVLRVRPVRGAHLDESHAGGLHDLGHPERAADLHQLAPRDQHLAVRRQAAEGQQHGGGVVVHRVGGLGARDRHELARGGGQSVAATALPQIQLQVRVRRGGLEGRARSALGQHRAAQVGVEDHPGGVHDPPGVGRRESGRESGGLRREDVPIGSLAPGAPGEGATGALQRQPSALCGGPGRETGLQGPDGLDQAAHGGQLPAGVPTALSAAAGLRLDRLSVIHDRSSLDSRI